MRIPADAIIPEEKLTRYLLVPRPWDDKSKFLSQGGFTLQEPLVLESAIRELAATVEAAPDGSSDYGDFYRVEGALTGPMRTLAVTLVWIRWKLDGTFHFVTLKPNK